MEGTDTCPALILEAGTLWQLQGTDASRWLVSFQVSAKYLLSGKLQCGFWFGFIVLGGSCDKESK